MLAKFSPAELVDLNRALTRAGAGPRYPETTTPLFVPLTATEACDLRDLIARTLIWPTEPAENARLCALASDLYRYSETARSMEARIAAPAAVA